MGALLISACGTLSGPAPDSFDSKPLALNYSNPKQNLAASEPVTVRLLRVGDTLVVQFKVTTPTIAAKPHLAYNEYPYQYDVVEVFVRNAKSDSPQYYEFEVSPYNQGLQVNVVAPRQEYCFGVQHGFTHSTKIVPGGWEADMRIPLASLGWNGKQPLDLVGNAYAALGENDRRVYWSLFELPAGPPDFHVPGAFRPLFATR